MIYLYILPMIVCIITTLIIYLRLKVVKVKLEKDTTLNDLYYSVRYLIIICTPLLNIVFAIALFILAIIIDNEEFKKIFSN